MAPGWVLHAGHGAGGPARHRGVPGQHGAGTQMLEQEALPPALSITQPPLPLNPPVCLHQEEGTEQILLFPFFFSFIL